MKSNFSPAAFRNAVNSVFLATILFSFFNAVFAQTNNQAAAKPKAILIAEWNKQLGKPTQTVSKVKFSALSTGATEKNLGERFASLKPTPLEEQAFALVNDQRLLQHLAPLVWDLEMLYLAREHSGNMARLNFFSHRGLDGKMADERAAEIGVDDWCGIGENIAFNQGVKNSVETAIQGWTNSPHHKENLLDKRWTRSGIGIAQTSEGKFYITQVFRD